MKKGTPETAETEAPARPLIEQLEHDAGRERRDALRVYVSLLERNAKPKPGDAAELQRVRTVLGRSLEDVKLDLQSFSAVQQVAAAETQAVKDNKGHRAALAELAQVEGEHTAALTTLNRKYTPRLSALREQVRVLAGADAEVYQVMQRTERERRRWEALLAGELDADAFHQEAREKRRAALAESVPSGRPASREAAIARAIADWDRGHRGDRADSNRVSPEFRQHVNAVLEHFGYRPLSEHEFIELDDNAVARTARLAAAGLKEGVEAIGAAVGLTAAE